MGRGTEEAFVGFGACFLWFLSLHEQRKKPARGAETAINARPQAARHLDKSNEGRLG